MYFTAKKPGQHPSISVGEQEKSAFKGNASKTSYPGGGVQSTVYNGDKSKTTKATGGKGGKAKSDYPKKVHGKFGTETGTMEKPCCGTKPSAV
jgi:hypothetical protein